MTRLDTDTHKHVVTSIIISADVLVWWHCLRGECPAIVSAVLYDSHHLSPFCSRETRLDTSTYRHSPPLLPPRRTCCLLCNLVSSSCICLPHFFVCVVSNLSVDSIEEKDETNNCCCLLPKFTSMF